MNSTGNTKPQPIKFLSSEISSNNFDGFFLVAANTKIKYGCLASMTQTSRKFWQTCVVDANVKLVLKRPASATQMQTGKLSALRQRRKSPWKSGQTCVIDANVKQKKKPSASLTQVRMETPAHLRR